MTKPRSESRWTARIPGRGVILGLLALGLAAPAAAKIDLVALPERTQLQVTIYNAVDLTLVREVRPLRLQAGRNRLELSWAGTRIDPTSLTLRPVEATDAVFIESLSFPPRINNSGVWTVHSEREATVPMEIQYLTSGLDWHASYQATLSPDGQSLTLQGFVTIQNRSGQPYREAEVRVIVGRVPLIDRIVDLAQREHPFGRPGGAQPEPRMEARARRQAVLSAFERATPESGMASRPKTITKEGVSEYYVYTIEGREDLADGWAKRLPNLTAEAIPVDNHYRYDEARYGQNARRFIRFDNTAEGQLGTIPLPGGELVLYREAADGSGLHYEGKTEMDYIPLGETAELDLGAARAVRIEPTLMDRRTENYRFESDGDVASWTQWRRFRIEVRNSRTVPATFRIRRHLDTRGWELTPPESDAVEYRQWDTDTLEFRLSVPPRTQETFHYEVDTQHGRR